MYEEGDKPSYDEPAASVSAEAKSYLGQLSVKLKAAGRRAPQGRILDLLIRLAWSDESLAKRIEEALPIRRRRAPVTPISEPKAVHRSKPHGEEPDRANRTKG